LIKNTQRFVVILIIEAIMITLEAKIKKKIMYCSEKQLRFEIDTIKSLKNILQEIVPFLPK